jgi:lysophospholipase L1-like esterase
MKKKRSSRTGRRRFLKLAGGTAGAAFLAACQSDPTPEALPQAQNGAPTPAPPVSAVPPVTAPTPTAPPPLTAAAPPPAGTLASLQAFLRQNAVPSFALPPQAAPLPTVTWGNRLASGYVRSTTLPDGIIVPLSSPLIGGPLRNRYSSDLPGAPSIDGYPCQAIQRPYFCKGSPRVATSPTVLRLKTNAPVVELRGVVVDGSATSQTLIVDGKLVPPQMLSSSLGLGGGFVSGAIRIEFGWYAMRDIWIETALSVAYLKVGAAYTIEPANDSAEPQMTVVGDSYLGSPSSAFPNGGGIAHEIGARLGIRKVALDAIGGTGYWNSGGNVGNLNDRLDAHGGDDSMIYLVMAGLNDYGDLIPGRVVWPARSTYENAVRGYLQNLRARQPNAVIVVTAPFCPIPPMSDSTYVANATNSSGLGDFLYKARLHKEAVQSIAGPWVYIDVLMGGGWLNSSGATGDITNLQWLTGGTPGPGTSPTYRPGNTNGGGGGGYGGIQSVPVTKGGRYIQAPEIRVVGGSGSGLQAFSRINAAGALVSVGILSSGSGYTPGPGLPTLIPDTSFEIDPGSFGTPTLITGVNPTGQYPLPSFAPPGTTPDQLNNVYTMLGFDTVHPSPLGVSYLARRLAQNVNDAILAL